MYDDKIMTVTDYSHSRVRRSNRTPSEISRELCHHRKRTKKWRPLRPIISEITTAIQSRTLTLTST